MHKILIPRARMRIVHDRIRLFVQEGSLLAVGFGAEKGAAHFQALLLPVMALISLLCPCQNRGCDMSFII